MVPPDSGRFAFKAFDGLEPMGFLCELGSAGKVTNHAAHTRTTIVLGGRARCC